MISPGRCGLKMQRVRGPVCVTEVMVALPEVASREQWLEARLRLLKKEKELTPPAGRG